MSASAIDLAEVRRMRASNPATGDATESDAWPTTRKLAWIEQVARDKTLSALALRFALVLAVKYVNRGTGDAWPSQKELLDADRCDLGGTPDGLRRAVLQLVRGGHLAVTRSPGGGTSNRYRPLVGGSRQVQNPRRQSGIEGEETPTPVGECAATDTPTRDVVAPDASLDESPTGVGPIPFEEPVEEPCECVRPPSPEFDLINSHGETIPTAEEQAFREWNETSKALGLPRARELTDDRRRKLRAALKRHKLDGWREALAALAAAYFAQPGHDGWKPDLDWLLKTGSLLRVLEGSYAGRGGQARAADPARRVQSTGFAAGAFRGYNPETDE